MSDAFTLRVDGQDAIERDLAGLHARLGDLTPLMDTIGMILEIDAQDNFTGEHSPDGVPWIKSARVVVGKAGPQRPTGKTLQDTRRLFLSLTHRSTATTAEVGTNVVYARRHNQGWSGVEQVAAHKRVMKAAFGVKLEEPITVKVKAHSRKANTPRRQFLGLSLHAREDIADAVETYVVAP
jgi:phage gpG-like protein